MWKSFRVKLVVSMVAFAVVIAFTIATLNHIRISEQAVQHNEFQLEKIEATVEYSLNTLDKVYYYFAEDLTEKMKVNTEEILKLYEANPNLDTWDFETLQNAFGMDIYMINSDNVITHSSKQNDVGMDFNECCGKLAKILDSRREAGAFFHDGMDIAQSTGEVTKYSYMATRDKEYLIELSYSLQDGDIFNDFNFLSVLRDLEAGYPAINEINILNLGGLALGDPAEESKLSPERRESFEFTLETGEMTEIREIDENGIPVIYHYIMYDSDYDFGSTQNKVIEISYNEQELDSVLQNYRNVFLIQLTFILLVTVILALIISKWVSRPMYMAFHDNLTGLRNRAAFEEDLQNTLDLKEGGTALLMIDLDHFKLVNDRFGHAAGDELLRNMAKTIQSVINSEQSAYRLGGDEFAVIVENSDCNKVVILAEQLITALNETVTEKYKSNHIDLTASIGIAFATKETRDVNKLYKQADRALYESKAGGKNQYQVYGLG